MPEITAKDWELYLSTRPKAHILQSREWGELKGRFGWEVVRIIPAGPFFDNQSIPGVQILFRSLPMGYSFGYIPKGPVGAEQNAKGDELSWEALSSEVDSACRKRRAVFMKVEPDLFEPIDSANEYMGNIRKPPPGGFRISIHSIQPPRTILVDIVGEERQILERMKQKTRYNIRLAGRKGIDVSTSADLETFHHLMIDTGKRDRFGVHSLEYYQCAYDLFHPQGQCELFLAEFQGQPAAGLMAFARGQRAWYFYGASAESFRERMPSYLLQWEAIRWARRQGCTTYDLWGVPDHDLKALEVEFAERSGGLWGVYRFKRGFGGVVRRAQGPWDRIYSPSLYKLYLAWLRFAARRNELVG